MYRKLTLDVIENGNRIARGIVSSNILLKFLDTCAIIEIPGRKGDFDINHKIIPKNEVYFSYGIGLKDKNFTLIICNHYN